MSGFKEELIGVIENYFVIDKGGFDISYQREHDSTSLLINSPVVVKRQETPGGNVGSKREEIQNKIKKAKKENKGKGVTKSQTAPATA
ncbi:UNVERIFIED_CONTAM: hypothetical protein GTU68_028126 [Idotea baltica]|nr:hypothetical protein [Idotea baltica]